MYIGRIVSIGQLADGRLCAMYRVSSRSFPNRTAVLGEAKVSIVPKPGFESDVQKNPYIAYNCVRVVCEGEVAVVSNGSHTDPIAEKMAMGLPARDAMTLSMLALDYEKDSYNTPRIAAVLDRVDGAGWLGVIREDGLEVRRMPLSPGRFFYVATYEENTIQESQSGGFEVRNAEEACAFILGQGIFAERENPVSAVAAVEQDEGYAFATADSRQD